MTRSKTFVRDYVLNFVPVKRRPRFKLQTGTAYTDAKTKREERAVREAYKGKRFENGEALALRVDVYRALPKSRPLKVSEETDTITPDLDNIVKAVMDGLQDVTGKNGETIEQGAYVNDSQIVEIHAYKHPRTRKAGDSIRFQIWEV